MLWSSGPPRSGNAAPAFELIDLAGQPVRAADFIGRPVVVNFFATWCATCAFELPVLETVAVDYADRHVIVLLVDVQQSRDTVAPFVEALEVNRARVALDLDGAVSHGKYRVLGLPATFFLDRRGAIRGYGTARSTPLSSIGCWCESCSVSQPTSLGRNTMDIENQSERAAYERWLAESRPMLAANEFREAFKTYPFLQSPDEVWTPLTKPLRECRVALISSAGLYVKDSQAPFEAESITGDTSYRGFPIDTPPAALEVAHGHYDPTAAMQDLNTVLPIDRLRELADRGVVGGLTPTIYSFMGYQTDAWHVRDRLGPELAERVVADEADVVLVAPV
ncbi:MAG: redoxin domain-containing protein [Chloroflexi bacterium]|nr:redoxin domain-containing protein [Chloroflexota bacterium]